MKESKKPRKATKANYMEESEVLELCANIRQRLTLVALFSAAYYHDNFVAVVECARYDWP